MNQPPSEKERKPKLKAHCQSLDPSVAPSTCSPHGSFLVQWNESLQTRPGLLQCSAVITESLAAASRVRIQWGHLLGSLMPLAHAHLERVHMSSDSSHEWSPAGLPTPKASTGCSLQLNKESCVSSLAPCPESHIVCKHWQWWAWKRIPVSERRQSREQILRLDTLLPFTFVEFTPFPTGSQGESRGEQKLQRPQLPQCS